MPIIEKRASTLSEVLSAAKAIRDTWNPRRDEPEEVWFRGQAKRSYALTPGLYRPAAIDFGYDGVEVALFHAFENLGLSYAPYKPANDWEWYFVSQHHGLPTRLLDWTESLLAATYFAIEGYWRQLDKRTLAARRSSRTRPLFDADSPTVWVTDAGSVNSYSQKEDVLYAPPRVAIESYLPRFLAGPRKRGCLKPDKPIALYPPRQTTRIIAQQGMFTLHGRNRAPLDVLAKKHDRTGVLKLGLIQLNRSRLAALVDELVLVGVTRLSLFPDLDSVAEHIKWQYRS